ncbi:23S rRNA (uracil(1939)-C(5))-methyltransferase RlmD [Acinetobacter apis]|uniref:23S rRNA (uracil(1939)-C(5))-methyltransferase RlmD n=1 Tax=Acinetobacter apis TaxID=1229165 RepID=A0A217EFY9_9GAMM|nr:23S rRNA (uracil(1939)-C(5))-methyltransferase RlmD [Acinetobacter apis]SNQ29267.1 23S rRNA (uracil1939-C5)-methyltransferase [Acinetobacter apis]
MKPHAKTRADVNLSYTFQIEGLSHEGRGIAHYSKDQPDHPIEKQGKKVFIQYALPGETVTAQIQRQSKRFEEADMLNVVETASVSRVTPICKHFQQCGGCSLQHMHPDDQIAMKQQVLKSHFQHFSNLSLADEDWLPAIRSLKTDYRRRARIGVRYIAKSKKLVMGFRARQSNHLIQIDECPVLDLQLNQALPKIYQVLQQLHGRADIGHIELCMGRHQTALLVRHTARLLQTDIDQLISFVKDRNWQLYLQPNGIQSVYRVDELYALTSLQDSLDAFAVNLNFLPTDFTQVNASVNEQMVELACKLLNLQVGERVLDLFCGLGNFSLPLARCVGETGSVVAVEGSEEMVQRGQANAKLNQMRNIAFYAQDLTQDFSMQPWANQGFDALLIDPPRSGADQVMQYISNFAAKRIVYVSCDPATLARDAGILVQHGYQLRKAGVMDMFTHTSHVESITLFEKIEQHYNTSE